MSMGQHLILAGSVLGKALQETCYVFTPRSALAPNFFERVAAMKRQPAKEVVVIGEGMDAFEVLRGFARSGSTKPGVYFCGYDPAWRQPISASNQGLRLFPVLKSGGQGIPGVPMLTGGLELVCCFGLAFQAHRMYRPRV